MKILLLSVYDAQSHRYLRESLVDQFEQYQCTVLSVPPPFFSYRVQANLVIWFIQRSFIRLIITALVESQQQSQKKYQSH